MKNGSLFLFIGPLTMGFGGSQNKAWTPDTSYPAGGLPDILRLSPVRSCVLGIAMGSTPLSRKYREIAPRRTARRRVASNPTRTRGTFHVPVFMVLR